MYCASAYKWYFLLTLFTVVVVNFRLMLLFRSLNFYWQTDWKIINYRIWMDTWIQYRQRKINEFNIEENKHQPSFREWNGGPSYRRSRTFWTKIQWRVHFRTSMLSCLLLMDIVAEFLMLAILYDAYPHWGHTQYGWYAMEYEHHPSSLKTHQLPAFHPILMAFLSYLINKPKCSLHDSHVVLHGFR